jgi:hypothetical protein
VFTRSCQRILSWVRWIQFTPSHNQKDHDISLKSLYSRVRATCKFPIKIMLSQQQWSVLHHRLVLFLYGRAVNILDSEANCIKGAVFSTSSSTSHWTMKPRVPVHRLLSTSATYWYATTMLDDLGFGNHPMLQQINVCNLPHPQMREPGWLGQHD